MASWPGGGIPPTPVEPTERYPTVVTRPADGIRALVARDGEVLTLSLADHDLLDPVFDQITTDVAGLVMDEVGAGPVTTTCMFGWLGGRSVPATAELPSQDAVATALCHIEADPATSTAQFWAEVPVTETSTGAELTVRLDGVELERTHR